METLTNITRTISKPRPVPKATPWVINTETSVAEISIKSFGLNVKGTLSGITGSLLFDDTNLAGSRFTTSLDVSSIDTGLSIRDKRLKRPMYLDNERYPYIVFRSDSITADKTGYKANGILILKGIWRHKTIPFVFEQKDGLGTFRSKFLINRFDYDIGGKSSIMSPIIKVKLKVDVFKTTRAKPIPGEFA